MSSLGKMDENQDAMLCVALFIILVAARGYATYQRLVRNHQALVRVAQLRKTGQEIGDEKKAHTYR